MPHILLTTVFMKPQFVNCQFKEYTPTILPLKHSCEPQGDGEVIKHLIRVLKLGRID